MQFLKNACVLLISLLRAKTANSIEFIECYRNAEVHYLKQVNKLYLMDVFTVACHL